MMSRSSSTFSNLMSTPLALATWSMSVMVSQRDGEVDGLRSRMTALQGELDGLKTTMIAKELEVGLVGDKLLASENEVLRLKGVGEEGRVREARPDEVDSDEMGVRERLGQREADVGR